MKTTQNSASLTKIKRLISEVWKVGLKRPYFLKIKPMMLSFAIVTKQPKEKSD